MGLLRVLRICNNLHRATLLQNGKKNFGLVRYSSDNAKLELTSERYKIERGTYATLNDRHVQFFKDTLDSNRVITDPDECSSYNVDWIKTVRGSSRKNVSFFVSIIDFKMQICPKDKYFEKKNVRISKNTKFYFKFWKKKISLFFEIFSILKKKYSRFRN